MPDTRRAEEKPAHSGLLTHMARFIEPEEEEELSSIHALPPRVDRSEAYHPAKTPQKRGRRKR